MKQELSILIPAYNSICTGIVERLLKQCEAREKTHGDFAYEIIVADDHSPHTAAIEANRAIAQMPHCRFIEKETNTGSAATRNFLADESRYEWMLFLDCDMEIASSDFIDNYMDCDHQGVVNGGIAIAQGPKGNLRYLYEKACEPNHTAEMRQKRPYHSFRSTNFMIERRIMQQCRFDERFKKSGYEDVLFGKQLKKNGIEMHHIDNPTVMTDFESNADYMDKIDRSLQTLYTFRTDLRGFSQLITLNDNIHLGIVRWMLRMLHRCVECAERKNLCSQYPSLKVFNLYRMGRYLTINH